MPLWVFVKNVIFNSKTPLSFDSKPFDKYGDTFAVNILVAHVICTRDPEIIGTVLKKSNKTFQKTKLQTEIFAKYLGRGLLTAKGDYWKRQRRLIQPGFHKEKIENLIAIIDASVTTELSHIKENEEYDVYPLMNIVAFQVVAATLFNVTTPRKDVERLQHLLDEGQEFAVREMQLPHRKLYHKIIGSHKKHERKSKEVRQMMLNIILERKQSDYKNNDLLDMLIDARYEDTGEGMTNEQLIDEVLILLAAGYDTTANVMTYTLWLLARHPEKANRVYEEILAAENVMNTPAFFTALNYTKSCLEEAMRLYPPSWIMDREPVEDTTIGEYHIKGGTFIGISFYQLHRHPDFWEKPNDFYPERFEGKSFKEFSNIFFPFGGGPRMCIGSGFVFYEMLLVIAKISKKYHLKSSVATLNLNPLVTLKPKEVPIKFIPRK